MEEIEGQFGRKHKDDTASMFTDPDNKQNEDDDDITHLQNEIEQIREEKDKEIKDLQTHYDNNLKKINEQYHKNLDLINNRHNAELETLQNMYEVKQTEVVRTLETKIEDLQGKVQDLTFSYEEQVRKTEIEKMMGHMEYDIKRNEELIKIVKADLAKDFEEKDDEILRLTKLLQGTKERCDQLETIIKQLEETNKNLKLNLQDKATEYEDELAKVKIFAQQEIQKSVSDLDKNKASVMDIQKFQVELVNGYNAEINRLREELSKMRNKYEEMCSANIKLEKINMKLSEETAIAKDQIEVLTEEFKTEKIRYEQELGRVLQMEKQQPHDGRDNDTIDHQKKYCNELEMIVQNLSRDNEEMELQIQQIKHQCNDHVNKLKQNMHEITNEYESKLMKLTNKLETQQRINKELDGMISDQQNEINELKVSLVEANSKCVEQVTKIRDDLVRDKKLHQENNLYLINELENINVEKSSLQDQIVKLQKETERLSRYCEDVTTTKTELEKSNYNLKSDLKDALESCDKDRQKILKQMEIASNAYEVKIASLESDLETKEKSFDDIRKIKEDLQRINRDIKEKLDETIEMSAKEVENFREDCEKKELELQDEIRKLSTILEDRNQQYVQLKSHSEELELRIENIKADRDSIRSYLEMELQKSFSNIKMQKKHHKEEIQRLKKLYRMEQNEIESNLCALTSELMEKTNYDPTDDSVREKSRSRDVIRVTNCNMDDDIDTNDIEDSDATTYYQDKCGRTFKNRRSQQESVDYQSKYSDDLEKIKKDLCKHNKMLKINLEKSNRRYEQEIRELREDFRKLKEHYQHKLEKSRSDLISLKKSYTEQLYKLSEDLNLPSVKSFKSE